MKLKSVLKSTTRTASIGLCIGLLASQSVLASGKPYKNFTIAPMEDAPLKKNKAVFSRNNNSVKIFMDSFRRKVHVISKQNKGKDIDFFVFDMEGTLVHNHKMKTKDHHRVTNLTKGVYVYRVFRGDEETAYGQFEIQ